MASYFFYQLGQGIAVSLPLRLAYAFAVFVADINYLFARKDKAAVRSNLKVIFPEKSEAEIRRIRRQMARNFAKYLVDFFRFSKLNLSYIAKNIRIEDIDNFDKALAKGKGVIALTAHLGNWELGGVVIGLLGYPFWAVALEHKDKRVNQFFNSQRQSKGVNVIPLGRAARQCLKVLRENKILALVGDRDFQANGVVADFFGKKAIFPAGAAAFALTTQAPIVPGFMFRNPDGNFTLKIEPAIEFVPSGDREKDIKDLIMKYKLVLEDYIRRYPEQWYMFRRFWIE